MGDPFHALSVRIVDDVCRTVYTFFRTFAPHAFGVSRAIPTFSEVVTRRDVQILETTHI